MFLGDVEHGHVSLALVSGPDVTAVGYVREISPAVDPKSSTVRVKVAIQNPPPVMTLGNAIAGTAGTKPATEITVPWTALMATGSKPAVWIVDPKTSTASLKPVIVGAYEAGAVQIKEGLEAGDRVVIDGGKLLSSGQPVTFAGDRSASIDTLRDLQLIGLGGQSVPLGAVATLRYEIEQPTIWRRSRIPTITLKASILDTVQPKTIVDQLAPKVDEFAKGLPAGYSVTIGGSVEESAKSQAPIAAVVPLMLFIMATILMIQLQSFHRLFLVFAVAPLALIGVVMALLPSGAPLGFVAILGVLALIGILIRNSVILIVQIEQLKEEGRPVWDAVVEATEHRMRPIMLTAAAASLALIPIAREIFWGPMAYAMMGGIIVGTVLTLLFLAGALCRVVPDQGAGARNGQHSRKSDLPPNCKLFFQLTRPLSANWKMHRSQYEGSSEPLHVRHRGIALRCVLCRL